jgi:class III poly(R)-hydroxyalkanoic acid synthase PhaE subunit
MDWSEQTNNMMKNWTDAQKQLLAGWINWAPGFGGGGGGQQMPFFDPTQWMKMGVDTWSGLQEGTPERLAGNILGTPDTMMRSMNLIMKSWQMVAPKIEQGQPWRPDLQKLLARWREEMGSAPKRTQSMANDFSELTKLLFERWTPMTAPWMAMAGQATASGHPAAAFLGSTSGINQIFGFEEGAFPLMTAMSDMPRGTVVRDKVGKMLAAVDSLTDLKLAQAEFQKKINEAMSTATERTIEHLAQLAEKGEKITSVRDLMRTWFGIADSTLNEAFMTPEFLETQNKMTEALLVHKVKQREALELIYDAIELPSKSALDEAYRDIQDLKREVRSLRKALKNVTGEAAPKPAAKRAAAKKPQEASAE